MEEECQVRRGLSGKVASNVHQPLKQPLTPLDILTICITATYQRNEAIGEN